MTEEKKEIDEIEFFMDESLLSADAGVTVTEAAKIMLQNKVGSLLIKEKGNFTGILTETDLALKVVAQEKDPAKTKVKEVMAQPLISINCHKPMAAAFLEMHRHNIRHIAVSRENKIAGILSIKDFANYYIDKFGKKKTS